MNIEWVGGVPSGNYQQGRSGNVPVLIVDHWIGTGTLDGAIAHFQSPSAGTSAHFIVGTTGRIVQMVKTSDTAYHAGDFQTNLQSIGIEHEATPGLAPSDALYAASAWLHAHLAVQYGFPITLGISVRPHNSIIATQCPGTLDLNRIVEESMALSPEDKAYIEAKFQELYGVLYALERRALRGQDALNPDNRPITTSEQINPSNGRG